jgi:hypothetical protein
MPVAARATFVIDCADYAGELIEDNMGFLTAVCACGWRCPPVPDEETRTDALMQHAYEAGILTERQARSGS